MPPMSSAPSTTSTVALSPTSSTKSGPSTAAALIAATSSVTRPSASVTTSRVRVGRRWPTSDAETGADEDRRDVQQRAESGEHAHLEVGPSGRPGDP